MLASLYDGENPVGWWMSEKYDGVRAIWDGKRLFSRNGNTFTPPEWFLNSFPKDTPLDGELYMGRGTLRRMSGLLKKKDQTTGWENVRFMVFDSPGSEPFEIRKDRAIRSVQRCKVIEMVPSLVVENERMLYEFLEDVVAGAGEGVILRAAGSMYEESRSKNLLKVFPFGHDFNDCFRRDYE